MIRLPRAFALALLPTFFGCNDQVTVVPTPPPCGSTIIMERLQNASTHKIDLVLAIDNSPSMADKQAILALAVPDLVRRFVNPPCVDEIALPVPNQPTDPLKLCPPGSARLFDPMTDVRIGVISSSIGGHGADVCPDVEGTSAQCAPMTNLTNNDHGHLLSRSDPCSVEKVSTFQDKGFLAWDPANKVGGETTIDDGNGQGLIPTLREMVSGVGDIGCKYESQLESIYRFLVDPNPYETITVDNNKAIPQGTDLLLLDQRRQFLRPDSMLVVVMLSDENDCSIKEYGQFNYIGQQNINGSPVRLPRPRQECAIDPHDPCCRSCGQSSNGCPDDPTCKDPNGGTGPALLTADEDDPNLRCWDQKRRFGIDFLYPTDRYVEAFSNVSVADRDGNVVPNPIFSDLDPLDFNSNIRDSGLVVLAGIVGVPWQDVARDRTDLKKGLKDASELHAPIDANGITTWDLILGDPAKNVQPLDPHMIETYENRTDLPDSSTPLADPIHGHERSIAINDLQYACIFPVVAGTERDCTNPLQVGCDCASSTNDNPLCAPNPGDNGSPTLQVRAKAYPSLRQLAVLKDIGAPSVVASVCPAQLTDAGESAFDFGYRSAVNAIMDRLLTSLGGAGCLPRTLIPDEKGHVPCIIIEALNSGGNCSCDPSTGRRGVNADSQAAAMVNLAKQDPLATSAGWDCYCEMVQLEGEARDACQNDTNTTPLVNGSPVSGWCYLDATTQPPTGNPELLAKCPDNEKRLIRYAGYGELQPGATTFAVCGGDPACF